MRKAFHVISTAAIVLIACSPPPAGRGRTSNSQLITQEEIEASRASSAFEVIQKLRPNFLSYRGETSMDRQRSTPYPTVYLDGQRLGRIETLRTLPAMQISSIRLYRSWEATTKFGSGNMGGVIEIKTRNSSKDTQQQNI